MRPPPSHDGQPRAQRLGDHGRVALDVARQARTRRHRRRARRPSRGRPRRARRHAPPGPARPAAGALGRRSRHRRRRGRRGAVWRRPRQRGHSVEQLEHAPCSDTSWRRRRGRHGVLRRRSVPASDRRQIATRLDQTHTLPGRCRARQPALSASDRLAASTRSQRRYTNRSVARCRRYLTGDVSTPPGCWWTIATSGRGCRLMSERRQRGATRRGCRSPRRRHRPGMPWPRRVWANVIAAS